MGAQNPEIYTTTYEGVESNLTPPNHRTPKWLAWLKALLYPLQWLHNNFFNDYASGTTAHFYNSIAMYNSGDKVIDIDNNVYECEVNNITNLDPHLNPGYWSLVCNDYRGVRPRILYNSQRLVLEKVLNQFFRTTFRVPPYTEIVGIATDTSGLGYTVPVATITGQGGSGRGAVGFPELFPLSTSLDIILLVNPGLGYLNPTITITDEMYDGSPGPGSGATAHLITIGNQPSDIFINNNIPSNYVFVVGENEQQSSTCVFSDSEALNFAEYDNDEYYFDDPTDPKVAYDFTIYVPQSLYNGLASTPLIGVEFINRGSGYVYGAPSSMIISGGNETKPASFRAFMLSTDTSPGPLTHIELIDGGAGYTDLPVLTINHPTTTGVTATARGILNCPQRDNVIRNVADKYVIAGMNYNIVTY